MGGFVCYNPKSATQFNRIDVDCWCRWSLIYFESFKLNAHMLTRLMHSYPILSVGANIVRVVGLTKAITDFFPKTGTVSTRTWTNTLRRFINECMWLIKKKNLFFSFGNKFFPSPIYKYMINEKRRKKCVLWAIKYNFTSFYHNNCNNSGWKRNIV